MDGEIRTNVWISKCHTLRAPVNINYVSIIHMKIHEMVAEFSLNHVGGEIRTKKTRTQESLHAHTDLDVKANAKR